MREQRDMFYWRAWQQGAESSGACLAPLSESAAEISRDGRRLRVSGSITSVDDPVTLQLAGDKPAVYRLLSQRQIPVPPHMVIRGEDFARAPQLLRDLPRPLVVKPAADSGAGAGVSTQVTTMRQLRHAIAWARAFGNRVLIESQIEGDCYRVLVMDQQVIDTVVRRQPKVVGDGRLSVRQLIARENRCRLSMGSERAQALIRRDPDLTNTLARQLLTLHSRPREGQVVELKRVVNDNRAEENEAANGRLCPAILNTARRAAEAIGVRLAGVDVICRDPLVPLEQSGGVIIDVNSTPGFYYHYCRVGESFPVADHVLQRFFAPVGACLGA